MGRVSPEDFAKARKLLRDKGVLTVGHIVEKLNIDSSTASKLFKMLKEYCLANFECIELSGALYYVKHPEHLKELQEKYLSIVSKKKDLRYLVLLILKALEWTKVDCVEVNDLLMEVLNYAPGIPSAHVLYAIYDLYRHGEIIEKRKLCFKPVL